MCSAVTKNFSGFELSPSNPYTISSNIHDERVVGGFEKTYRHHHYRDKIPAFKEYIKEKVAEAFPDLRRVKRLFNKHKQIYIRIPISLATSMGAIKKDLHNSFAIDPLQVFLYPFGQIPYSFIHRFTIPFLYR